MNRFLLYSLPWLERNSPKKPFFNFGFGSNMKFPVLGPNKKSFHRAHHAAPLGPGQPAASDLMEIVLTMGGTKG